MGYFQALVGAILVAVATSDYVGPSDYNRRPSTSYGTPAPSYDAPSNSYGAPSGAYDDGQWKGGDERPKSYQFGYAVKDHASGNDFGRHESSDGDTVKGQYRVQLPDGRTQVVTYTADWKNGFQAKVTYEGEAFFPDQHQNQNNGGYDYTPKQGSSYSSSNNKNSYSGGNSYNSGGNSYKSSGYKGSNFGSKDSYNNFGSTDSYSNDYSSSSHGHSNY